MSKKNSPVDYFSPEAREARRQARLSKTASVSGAFGTQFGQRFAGANSRLTTQNAGIKAVAMVREMFDNYRLPAQPKLSYSGLRGGRTAANSSKLEDGVITIHAEFKTFSGINVGIDVPVEINSGDLLEPSVVLHDGFPRVIAQSTFDDIVGRNTQFDTMPVREMYSQPMDPSAAKQMYSNRIKAPRMNKGMFSVSASREAIRRAISLGTDVEFTASRAAQLNDVDWGTEVDKMEPDFDIDVEEPPDSGQPAQYFQHDTEMSENSYIDMGHEVANIAMDQEWDDTDVTRYVMDVCEQYTDVDPDKLLKYVNMVRWDMPPVAVDPKYTGKAAASSKSTKTTKSIEPKPPKQPKPPKTTKPPAPPKLKAPPSASRLCSKCSSAPCRCPNKRKKKAQEFGLSDEGLPSTDFQHGDMVEHEGGQYVVMDVKYDEATGQWNLTLASPDISSMGSPLVDVPDTSVQKVGQLSDDEKSIIENSDFYLHGDDNVHGPAATMEFANRPLDGDEIIPMDDFEMFERLNSPEYSDEVEQRRQKTKNYAWPKGPQTVAPGVPQKREFMSQKDQELDDLAEPPRREDRHKYKINMGGDDSQDTTGMQQPIEGLNLPFRNPYGWDDWIMSPDELKQEENERAFYDARNVDPELWLANKLHDDSPKALNLFNEPELVGDFDDLELELNDTPQFVRHVTPQTPSSDVPKKREFMSGKVATDLVAKVEAEVKGMRDQGLSDIDCRMAVQKKYGGEVVEAIFKKVAPNKE